jgi:hypothetical protein
MKKLAIILLFLCITSTACALTPISLIKDKRVIMASKIAAGLACAAGTVYLAFFPPFQRFEYQAVNEPANDDDPNHIQNLGHMELRSPWRWGAIPCAAAALGFFGSAWYDYQNIKKEQQKQ